MFNSFSLCNLEIECLTFNKRKYIHERERERKGVVGWIVRNNEQEGKADRGGRNKNLDTLKFFMERERNRIQ